MEKVNKRLAVLVGCNYPNTPNELHGCINDVVAMRDILIQRFGFEATHVELLTDAPPPALPRPPQADMPTGANIRNALRRMVDQAEAGDVLFFHYSGHGTRIPSLKPAHPFRQEEAIVPCDFNLITDLDFRQLVNQVPKGATFTILSDSCHSGGLIDAEKEQIGPSSVSGAKSVPSHKPKTIPLEAVLQHLASLTGIKSFDLSTQLLHLFGANASLRFRVPSLVQQELGQLVGSSHLRVDEGILLSGCQANETSADMNPSGGKAFGAFSNAVQVVLKQNLSPLSNRRVVSLAREVLKAQGFDQQHPCLYCSDANADANFVCQPAQNETPKSAC